MAQAPGAAPVRALREAQDSGLVPLTLQQALAEVGLLGPVADAQYGVALEGHLALELRQPPYHEVRFPFASLAIDFTVGDAEVASALEAVLPPEAHEMITGRIIRASILVVQLAAYEAFRAERLQRHPLPGARGLRGARRGVRGHVLGRGRPRPVRGRVDASPAQACLAPTAPTALAPTEGAAPGGAPAADGGGAAAQGAAAAEAPAAPAPYSIELCIRVENPLTGRLAGQAISQDFMWGSAWGSASGAKAVSRVVRQLGRTWHVAHAPDSKRPMTAGSVAQV